MDHPSFAADCKFFRLALTGVEEPAYNGDKESCI